MTGTEVAALVAACIAAGVAGALGVLAVQLHRTLRANRAALDAARAETLAAIEALRDTVRRAQFELDRIDALYSTAESLSTTADTASKIAYKTVSSPVVKAVAAAAGTRSALRRLRSERR